MYMKFVSPVQRNLALAPLPVKVAPPQQGLFSSIFASELHSLSNSPSASSGAALHGKTAIDLPCQMPVATAKTSFTQLFPNLTTPVVSRESGRHQKSNMAETSNKIVPGIMYLPMPPVALPVKADTYQASSPRAIDIASIVNFTRPNSRVVRAASQSGAIASIGDNPSVFIANRSQTSTNVENHYNTEPRWQKSGIMSGGFIVGLRMQI